MRAKLPVLALFALTSTQWGLSYASAQSLGDVARKEEERRKAVTKPAKVLTNGDLKSPPVISPPPDTLIAPAADIASATGGAASGEKPAAEEGKKPEGETPAEAPAKDQAYWSGRYKEIQTEIARNQSFAAALQSRINALTTEFTNQSDPVQQARLGTDRQSVMAELDRVNKQIQDDQTALNNLQEEARRAGVPAGWLR